MIDKTMRSLVLLTAMMGLSRTGVLAAEALPPRALARIGDHRFYHGPEITCAVLSPDGRRIASAANYHFYEQIRDKERDAYNRTIVLWDAATGERLRELRVPRAGTCLLSFSPDGKRLAADYCISEEKDGIAVFEVKTGKLLRRLEGFKSLVNHVQFSADGKQLQVSEHLGPVSAWDAATGKQLRLWKPPPDGDKKEVCGVRGMLSPDGKVMVWEMGNTTRSSPWDAVSLRVHDAETDRLLYQKKFKHDGPLAALTFSQDSKRFAAAGDKFTVWETATGTELATIDVPKEEVEGFNGERVALPKMYGFALAPDGQHAVILERDSPLRWWDLKTGKPTRNLCPGFVRLRYDHLSEPQVFSADGKTLLVATDSTLRLVDTATDEERAVSGHRAPITPRFSADGRTLFTSCDEKRCRWDISGKKPTLLKQEPRKTWEIHSLLYSTDEQLFLDTSEDHLRVRETATGRVLRGLDDSAFCGRFSQDTTKVLLYPDAIERDIDNARVVFRVYDVKIGKALTAIKPMAPVGDPIFSPNGRFVAWADHTGAVHLHDAVTGKAVRTLRSSQPLSKAKWDDARFFFSRDGEQLLVTTYTYEPGREKWTTSPMRVFQVSSGREILRFYANPEERSKASPLSCAAWSPDGRLLAVAEEESGIIRLIELASGKVRVEFAGHRHGVHGLAFAPDGKTLASGGEDNVVFLWDVTGAKTLPATVENLASWWNDLASEDAKRAGIAIASLLRKPEASVAFLQEKLRPAKAMDQKRLAQRIRDLDADDFDTREAASRELIRLGERAETALRHALMNRPSLEARRRIEVILSKLEPSPPPPETLRMLRAIEVLEHMGTPAARRCLEAMAKGATEARQTRDAKAALQRLAKCR